MSKSKPKSDIQTRLIIPIQSVGRCGKSTFCQGLMGWLNFAGVEFSAADADGEHGNLHKWFEVPLFPVSDSESFMEMIASVDNDPVVIIDYPAQSTDLALEAIKRYKVAEELESRGIKMTIPIFASDETNSLESSIKIYSALKDVADFIVVENSARFTSKAFNSSKLKTLLKDSPVIQFPALARFTLSALQDEMKARKEHFSFAQASEKLSDIGAKADIDYFNNQIYSAFEDMAEILIPDLSLLKNKVVCDSSGDEDAAVSVFDL